MQRENTAVDRFRMTLIQKMKHSQQSKDRGMRYPPVSPYKPLCADLLEDSTRAPISQSRPRVGVLWAVFSEGTISLRIAPPYTKRKHGGTALRFCYAENKEWAIEDGRI